MGTSDMPPPHVTPSYMANVKILLAIGGLGYTLAYILMTRQSLRDRTYAMPLSALGVNVAWEIIFGLFVAERLQEKVAFTIWLILDVGLIYALLKYGPNEWKHAPVVGRHIGKILTVMVVFWCWAFWSFSVWWLDPRDPVNPKSGKIYHGIEGVDSSELGGWTALFAQVVLSATLLAQIVVRGTSSGASYAIWISRFFGSFLGLNVFYGYRWYVWPEAHGYVVYPFTICLGVSWVVADLVYLWLLVDAKRTEVVLGDGRKVRGSVDKTAKAS